MILHYLARAVFVAVGCVSGFGLLRAQDAASPFGANQQYSADMVITTDKGDTLNQKIYSDNGKTRIEMNAQGMQVTSIARPDLKKMYTVMESQKMVMEMPIDPDKYKNSAGVAATPQGKFETIGPDTVDGIACTKDKMTANDGKIFFFWINAADKTPVKMLAADNSVTILWKNYKSGPQDASLFEPPTGYQVMAMPAMPGGMPGRPGM